MSPTRSPLRRISKWLAATLGILLLVAAGARWLPQRPSPGAAAIAAERSTALPATVPPSTATPHVADGASIAATAGSPPRGLTAAQWKTLDERIEPGPDHDRELARIANLMAFRADVDRLRELRRDPAAREERGRLAREIDTGIELHLALRETTAPEALLLKSAVLEETVPDATERAAQLEAFRARLASAHPPANDPRVAVYQRQEAAIVAEWQSRPASQRDPAALARRLRQLQVAVFEPGS